MSEDEKVVDVDPGKRARILAELKKNWKAFKKTQKPTPKFFYRGVVVGAQDKARWAKEVADDAVIRHDVDKKIAGGNAGVTQPEAEESLKMQWYSYNFKLAQFDGLATTFDQLSELEVIRDTSRGAMLLAEAKQLRQDVAFQVAYRRQTKTLAKRFADPGEDHAELVREYWIMRAQFERRLVDFGRRMDDLEEKAAHVLEFEAVKAWVSNKKNADASDAALKAARAVASNGIKSIEFGADKVGLIPDHHSQAAKAILKVICAGADAGLSLAAKQAKSMNNDRKVRDYLKNNPPGAIRAELNKNPLLIAEMLAEKRIANTELALDLIRPLVVAASQLVKFAEPLYLEIRRVVVKATEAYQKERLARARELLGMIDEDDPVGTFAEKLFEDAGTSLLNRIQDNVFSVLDPVKLAKDVVADVLAARIAELIMKYLPIDPAQPFDGAQLDAEIKQITTGRFKNNPFVRIAT